MAGDLQLSGLRVQVATTSTESAPKYTSELGTNRSSMGLASMVLGLPPQYAEEIDTSIKTVTSTSTLTFTQAGALESQIVVTGESTLTFTQLGERLAEVTVTATSSITFTQADVVTGPVELTGSNTLVFTQNDVVASPKTLGASNTIVFSQDDGDNSLQTRTGYSYIGFTSTANIAGEKPLDSSNTLVFTQSSNSGLYSRSSHSYLVLTQSTNSFVILASGIDVTASHTLAFTQTNNRVHVKASGDSLTADHTIAFTQNAIFPIELDADSTITFTQSADGVAGKSGTTTIVFTQSVIANHDRSLTATSPLTLTHGFIPVQFRNGLPIQGSNSCDATKTYSPFSGGDTPAIRPVAPALTRKTDVQFYYPTGPICGATSSIVLRTPNFGDRDRNQYTRINRESRGGSLTIFRDPVWPSIRTLVMDFSGIKDSEVYDIIAFLEATLGQQIGFRDWNSRVWYGLIVNPSAAITRTGTNRNDLAIEMEVTDTALEVNACSTLSLVNAGEQEIT